MFCNNVGLPSRITLNSRQKAEAPTWCGTCVGGGKLTGTNNEWLPT